jgi:hypothetical protein
MRDRRSGTLDGRRWFRSVAIPIALLGCVGFSGQSEAPLTQLRTFHVQGVIRTYYDSVVPNTKVTFDGHESIKTVFANNRGFYETDLAVGLYTMTAEYLGLDQRFVPSGKAQDGLRKLQPYQRPLFRVASPTSLTLNVTLDPPDPTCEPGYGVGPSASSPEGALVCGGQDRFAIPSDDKVPFELLIRYRARRPAEKGYLYDGSRGGSWNTPVFVAYDLFTLQADHVTYDSQSHVLQANGRCTVEDPDGRIKRADSMAFKIDNGEAVPIP